MFEKIFTRNPRLARLALRSLVSGTLGRAAGGACGHRVYIFSSRAPGSFQPAPACDCMPVQGEVFPGRTPQDSAYSPTPHPIGWVARVWWPCGFHPRRFLSKVDLLAPALPGTHHHMTEAAALSEGRLCPRHKDGTSCRGHLKICRWKIKHEFANCVPRPGNEVFKGQVRDASCLSC